MEETKEYVMGADFASYETIRALKEGMSFIIEDSKVDDIKLVGASLIFVDVKSGLRYEHKEKVSWFDESVYEDDYEGDGEE